MWKKFVFYSITASFVFATSCNNSTVTQIAANTLIPQENTLYDINLDELMEIKVVKDSNAFALEPTYDIPIEDLMKLEIVKEIVPSERLSVSYDIPLEDLLKLEIPVKKNNSGSSVSPSYEMSLKGLLEIEIQEEYSVKTYLKLSYDISIEGLLQLDLADLADEE